LTLVKKQTILDAHLRQFHEISIQNSTGLKRLGMADSMTVNRLNHGILYFQNFTCFHCTHL